MSYRHCQISLRRARLEAVCTALSGLQIPEISLRHTDRSSLSDDRPEAVVLVGCDYPCDHEPAVIAALVASGRTHRPGDLSIRFVGHGEAADEGVKGAVTLLA